MRSLAKQTHISATTDTQFAKQSTTNSYWPEDASLDGATDRHGPISAIISLACPAGQDSHAPIAGLMAGLGACLAAGVRWTWVICPLPLHGTVSSQMIMLLGRSFL